MADYTYALEQLFCDQEPRIVRHYVAPLLSWHYRRKLVQPVNFHIMEYGQIQNNVHSLSLTWDMERLRKSNGHLDDDLEGYIKRDGPDCERHAEKAAMCLGFIYASVILQKRIQKINIQAAPDLLYDVNPISLRGIEVAGRGSGGLSKLMRVRNSPEKYRGLHDNTTVVEAYLSLWCCRPAVSHWEKVK